MLGVISSRAAPGRGAGKAGSEQRAGAFGCNRENRQDPGLPKGKPRQRHASGYGFGVIFPFRGRLENIHGDQYKQICVPELVLGFTVLLSFCAQSQKKYCSGSEGM